MLTLTREESVEWIMDNVNEKQKQQLRLVNGRQQSPHPANIFKGQSAAAAELHCYQHWLQYHPYLKIQM